MILSQSARLYWLYRPVVRDAGVVHQDVERAVSLHRGRDQPLPSLSGFVTSRWTYFADAPSAVASASPSRSNTSPMTTFAPSATVARAIAAPMPRAPPVTSTTFPSSRDIKILCLLNSEMPSFRTSARSSPRALSARERTDIRHPSRVTKVGRSNRNGRLAPGTDICEPSPPTPLIGSCSFGSSPMNSPPFIHSFWTNSNCRSMSAWMNRLIRPRSTPSSSSAPVREMRAVLDATPDQPVPPAPRSRA